MPLSKGRKKTGGRVKGTPNKKTAQVLKQIEYVLSLLDKTIEQDIYSLKPAERAKMWNDLQEYIRPKLARSEIKHEGEVMGVNIILPTDKKL